MQAKDIMKKDVITMTPKINVLDAIKILVDNRISGAPVLDNEGRLFGMITEKDLLVSMDFLGIRNAKEVSIEEFMTRDVVSFAQDAYLEDIARELVRNNIKRVPIVAENKVIGIVSRRDVLSHILNG